MAALALVQTMLIKPDDGAASGAPIADLAGLLRSATPVMYRLTWWQRIEPVQRHNFSRWLVRFR